MCGSKWETLTGTSKAFIYLGTSTARHGCCPANKYMSDPFITFSEAASCSACPATSIPNDEISCPTPIASLKVCTWHDQIEGIWKVHKEGCKMSKMITVEKGPMAIHGVSGSYHELQSNRVDKQGTSQDSSEMNGRRHFLIKAPGKLTLHDLKLSWGEVGILASGSCIHVMSGTLTIRAVHFYGLATTSPVGHALNGGALYVFNGEVSITDSTFEGFGASVSGGAIYVGTTSDPMKIESTAFIKNWAGVSNFFLI